MRYDERRVRRLYCQKWNNFLPEKFAIVYRAQAKYAMQNWNTKN